MKKIIFTSILLVLSISIYGQDNLKQRVKEFYRLEERIDLSEEEKIARLKHLLFLDRAMILWQFFFIKAGKMSQAPVKV